MKKQQGISLLKNLTLNPEYKHIQNEIKNIKTIFHDSDTTIHKARNQLKIVEINGEKYVVKSFKRPHFFNRLVYTFIRKTKAQKSYENAITLNAMNINTPDPVAYLHFTDAGLLDESYFISKYLPYNFTIREVFRHSVENYKELLEQFAAFTYVLHTKGIWHKDYTSGNILITQEEDNVDFWLVDINRMQFKTIDPLFGLSAFSKFFSTVEDLEIMVHKYASLASLDYNKAYKIAFAYYTKVQKRKNFKAKLKGKNS